MKSKVKKFTHAFFRTTVCQKLAHICTFVQQSAKNLHTCVLSYDSLPESKEDGNLDLLQLAFWLTVVQKYACANFLAFDFISYLKTAEGIVWGEKYCNFVYKIQKNKLPLLFWLRRLVQSNQSTPFSNHFLFYSIINFILVQQRFFFANNDPHFYECKEIVHKEPFNSIIKSTFCAFAFELDLQSVDWERFFFM